MGDIGKLTGGNKGRPSVYSGEGYAAGESMETRKETKRPRQRLTEAEGEVKRPRQRLSETEGESRRPRQRLTGPQKNADTQEARSGNSLPAWKEKLKQRRKRRLHVFFGMTGAVIAVGYIGAAVYFHSHFYEGTTVYGIDCSQKTIDEVKLEIEDKLDDYVLEIQERKDKTETISASQIGLQYVDNGGVDRMMKAQRSYIWPVMMLLGQGPADSVSFSYDRDMALKRLNELDCTDSLRAEAPQDAYIAATDTGYEVAAEVMGTTLDTAKTEAAVLKALDNGAVSVSLEEEDCYINPQIYQDDKQLQSDAEAMSELARAKITYTFGNETEVVDAALIRDWIVKLGDGSFVIDDVCAVNYVESLAAKYDTFGLPVDFYTSIGTIVTLSGGDYGWCIDQDATTAALLNALAEGYRGEMEPVYLYSAMSHENGGIGYTYVEICISQQRMWCYQDGNLLVDTPVVTGNPNKGDGTPSGGVWAIDAKKRDAILTGEGYTSPVDYWMPFNGDVGIHDLQQRAYFGGTIYLTNGSHGCVNTPYEQVQIIYDTVSIGTPVIVYD